MTRKIITFLCLLSVISFAGCSILNTEGTSGTDITLEPMETSSIESEAIPEQSDITSQETPSTDMEIIMQNIEFSTVPLEYYNSAKEPGSLETFTYDTKNYIGDGKVVQSRATVYLPYGYNKNDVFTRYNILYLQHGAYGNERTWMYEYGNSFKNMIDHMIEDQVIAPLIIVMPYLPSGNEWYHDTTPIFYSEEIKNDLMPAVESHFHTYADGITDTDFIASRSHRAFGGFSAGGTTTWRVFLEGLDRFEYFMPMSGGLTLGGDGSTDMTDAQQLADAAVLSGYGKKDYYIFAATGTRDVAYQGLSAQIEAMKLLTEAFDYTDDSFADGNLMYYVVSGNRHDYQYTYEYVYNGLRLFVHQEHLR